jgi:PKD repeat protein
MAFGITTSALRLARGRAAVVLAFGLSIAFALLGMTASRASAVIVHLEHGNTVSYQSLRGHAPTVSFDAVFSNLDYNGGQVMSSNTNYAVYWRPSTGPAYPADYQPGVNRYFEDLAHDSGGHENVDSVSSQYNDATGGFASYNSHFGGAIVDTDPYPPNGCTQAPICLTDEQIRKELKEYVTAHGLPVDLSHEYFVLTPPGVEDCFQALGTECSAGSAKPWYCAYHGNFSLSGSQLIYSNDPYVTGNAGCDDGNHPNGTTADGVLEGGLSHEHNESVTDPQPNNAWADFATGEETGFEIGDKCRNVGPSAEFGTPLGEVEVAGKKYKYNQVINGHLYWYQQEWSNQTHSCLQRLTSSGGEPSATFTSTPVAGNQMSFDASGSSAPGEVRYYSWQFRDGSAPVETTSPTFSHTFPTAGFHLVALTVYAEDGTSAGGAGVILTGDEGPTARFSAPIATPGQPVSFSGSTSTDPDGSITADEWNFGDGSTGAGSSPSHTYAALGTYTATLVVEDSSGQVAVVSHPVVVDEAPTASFSVTTPSPTAGQGVSFIGSASSDPDGSIAGYSWNFGDGSAGAGATPSHIYAAPGNYTVTLTITDSGGVTNAVSHAVAVAAAAAEPTNLATTATTAALASAPPPNSGFTPGETVFNQKTGELTFTQTVGDPGTFSWLLTFQNGKFGVFAASSHTCKTGLVRLAGKCRPSKIVFAKGSQAVATAGTVTFKLKPSASALKALKNALRQKKGLSVTATFTFQSARGGSPVSHTLVLTVKLKKR